MPIDVDVLLTDAALDEYMGGAAITDSNEYLRPQSWTSLTPAKTWALSQIMRHLRRQMPGLTEDQITEPTELVDLLASGAAMRLYWLARTSGDEEEVHNLNFKEYKKLFKDELSDLRITTSWCREYEDDHEFDVNGEGFRWGRSS